MCVPNLSLLAKPKEALDAIESFTEDTDEQCRDRCAGKQPDGFIEENDKCWAYTWEPLTADKRTKNCHLWATKGEIEGSTADENTELVCNFKGALIENESTDSLMT